MMQGENMQEEGWFARNQGLLLKLFVFVALLIIILFSTGYIKKLVVMINPDAENCKGGTCRDSCIKIDELQEYNSKCSDTSKVCCVPNTKLPSPECDGRKQGDPCGKILLCDENSVCISRCEYCSKYPQDISCNITGVTIGKQINGFDETFSCGCTEMDCNEFDNSRLGTCVKGYCPSENIVATDHMCCSTPYK